MPVPLKDSSSKGHFDFLDGLRGVAALYVVMFHAAISVVPAYEKGVGVPLIFQLLMFGSVSVMIFIILSGFCLMLPVARSPELALWGGFRGFIGRRARRILPPYYVTLAASFLLPVLMTLLHTHHRPRHWLMPWCNYGGYPDLLAHIALVHNLRPQWTMSILAPLWTIAPEWQIYFLFALLLLPVMRRWGTFATLATSIVIGLLPIIGFLFVISFAVGMIGAVIARMPGDTSHTWRKNLFYRLALPGFALMFLPDSLVAPSWTAMWRPGIIVGLLIVWLILAAYHQTQASPRWTPRRLLEMRPVVALGRFSYSLYLTHALVLYAFANETAPYHLAPATQASLNLAVGTPLAVACAWAFYLVFERPFLNKPVAPANDAANAHTIKSPVSV